MGAANKFRVHDGVARAFPQYLPYTVVRQFSANLLHPSRAFVGRMYGGYVACWLPSAVLHPDNN